MFFIALIMAATPAEALHDARKSYASCLTEFTNGAVDRKMQRDEFLDGIQKKCAAKETKFREAVIAVDKVDGMTDAEAAEDADDQVAGYVEKMTDDFDSAK